MRSQCYKFKREMGLERKQVLVCARKYSSNVADKEVGGGLEKGTFGVFGPYVSTGNVAFPEMPNEVRDVTILRDCGSAQSMLLESVLPEGLEVSQEEVVLLGGFPDTVVAAPVVTVNLKTTLVNGPVKVALVKSFPVVGVDLLLGNDLVHHEVGTDPLLVSTPNSEVVNELNIVDEICPISVVTRSQVGANESEEDICLDSLFKVADNDSLISGEVQSNTEKLDWSRQSLIKEQKSDPEISQLRVLTERGRKLSGQYFMKDDLLMRKYRPVGVRGDVEWQSVEQIVIPLKYRSSILEKAHENLFAAHVGIGKTFKRVSRNFFWPKLKRDVARHCKTCHECQVAGKPNQVIPRAPLVPIPSVGEPFEHILIDVVGPLPKSHTGAEYLLTIMDRITRYPEAIPLRSIHSANIVKHLV